MTTTEPTERPLAEITCFPTDFRHPDTNAWVRAVGYFRPHKHLSGVLAYADPVTNEYEGMLLAHDGPSSDDVVVETRSVRPQSQSARPDIESEITDYEDS